MRRPISLGSSIDIITTTPEPRNTVADLPDSFFISSKKELSYMKENKNPSAYGILDRINEKAAAYVLSKNKNLQEHEVIENNLSPDTNHAILSRPKVLQPENIVPEELTIRRPSMISRNGSNLTSKLTASFHTAYDSSEADVERDSSESKIHLQDSEQSKSSLAGITSDPDVHTSLPSANDSGSSFVHDMIARFSENERSGNVRMLNVKKFEKPVSLSNNDSSIQTSSTSDSSLERTLRNFPKPVHRRSIHEIKTSVLAKEAPVLPEINSGGQLMTSTDSEHDEDCSNGKANSMRNINPILQELPPINEKIDTLVDLPILSPQLGLLPAISDLPKTPVSINNSASNNTSSATLIDRKGATPGSLNLFDSPLRVPTSVEPKKEFHSPITVFYPSSAPPEVVSFQNAPLPRRGMSNQPRAIVPSNLLQTLSMPPKGSQFTENFLMSPTSTLAPLAQSTNTEWWMPPAAPKLSPDESAFAPLPPTERKSSSILPRRSQVSSDISKANGSKRNSAISTPLVSPLILDRSAESSTVTSPMAPMLFSGNQHGPIDGQSHRALIQRRWFKITILVVLFVVLPIIIALVVWLTLSSTL